MRERIIPIAALVFASCTDDVLPELPPPCEGYYNTEMHYCQELMPTCEDENNCVTIGENCEITLAEEEGHAYEIICEGERVGYLDNGKPGEKGEPGLNGTHGENCFITNTLGGVEITCAAVGLPFSHGTNGTDGKDGTDGIDGENCTIAQKPAGVEITCEGVAFTFSHGETGYTGDPGEKGGTGPRGNTGQDCTIEETLTGVKITCGTVIRSIDHGGEGEPGGKGTSDAGKGCTIEKTDEGVEITCDKMLSLKNGEDGEDGSEIKIGEDGYWYIDGIKTTIKAKGDKGDKGKDAMQLFDGRDYKFYKYVVIGEQIWMAENLNYNAPSSICYDDDPENCEKYGRLYDWATAKTACPNDWHLPSDEEWGELTNYVEANPGTKLKATSGWNDNGNGTDDFGFSALPGGRFGRYGPDTYNFDYAGSRGMWWTTTVPYSALVLVRQISSNSGNAEASVFSNDYLLSVRCIRNDKCGTSTYNPATHFCDSRDGGTVYKKVKIGTQTWMAQNLNYNAPGSVCHDNQESNCNTYGRLYDWNTAMAACPEGWHLPSDAEWDDLMRYVQTDNGQTYDFYYASVAGKYLKAASDLWNSNGKGEDKYGFAALPGGFGHSSGSSFYRTGEIGWWWSSSDDDYGEASTMLIDIDESAYLGSDTKDFMSSVRCVEGD